MKRKIIIIGSGIAGLSTAVSLQKMDIDVKVYESSIDPRVAGAGIIIAPNALQALQPFGITDELIRVGKESDGFRLLSEKGKTLSKLTIPTNYQKMYSIHRKDLHHLLLSSLEPNTVVWGKEFMQLKQDAHGVQITFRDGSTVSGDILIAADGIHSPIRKQLFKQEFYRYAGYTCWRGVISSKGISNIANDFIETWGAKGRFGIVPLPNGQIYWYALVNSEQNDTNFSKYTLNDLYQRFKDYHHPIPSLLKNTENHQMIHRDIIDIVPMKKFFMNRTVFIGDAAHAITPNMGQGACQAIEDARILAECIKKYVHVEQAFAVYSAHRMKRIQKISNQSWKFGKIAQMENPILIALRNQFLKHTPQSFLQKQAHSLYKFQLN